MAKNSMDRSVGLVGAPFWMAIGLLLLVSGGLWMKAQLERRAQERIESAGVATAELADQTQRSVKPSASLEGDRPSREVAEAMLEEVELALAEDVGALHIQPPPLDGVDLQVMVAAGRLPASGAVVTAFNWRAIPSYRFSGLGFDLGVEARKHGLHFQADEHGVVKLPRTKLDDSVEVVCDHEGLWGSVRVQAFRKPDVLWLYPNPTIDVQVLDQSGLPVPGARVGLHYVVDGDGDDMLSQFTNDQGQVQFTRLRQYTDYYWPNTESLNVALMGLFDEPEMVRLEPPEFPKQIVLTMPPRVGLEVLVLDELGNPYEGARSVGLNPLDRPDLSEWEYAVTAECEHGRASFKQLSPEMNLEVQFDGDDRYGFAGVEVRTAGEIGQTTPVVIQLKNPKGILRGRALDHSGVPLANCPLLLVWFEDRSSRSKQIWSDAEGHFEVGLGTQAELTLRCTATPDQSAVPLAFSRRFNFGAAGHSLGDCRFKPLPLLVSGTALDQDGQPLAGARITCRPIFEKASHRGASSWNLSDEAGRFEVRGWLTSRPLAEDASHSAVEAHINGRIDGYRADFRRVPLSSRDVVMTFEQVGSVEGSVLLDAEWHHAFLEVWSQTGNEEPEIRGGLGEGGHFKIRSVPPGTHDFIFCASDEFEEGLRVTNVEVGLGARTTDSRLWDVDLRGRLHIVNVDVAAADGNPIEDGDVFWRSSSRSDEGWERGQSFWEGNCQVYTMCSNLDLYCSAYGYLAETRNDVRASEQFVLRAAPKIKLSLTGGAVQTSDEKLGTLIWTLEAADLSVPQSLRTKSVAFAHAEAQLPIAGEYSVQVALNKDGDVTPLEGAKQNIVVLDKPELQDFRLNLDLSEWLSLLADTQQASSLEDGE